jgi:hypothetical protein
MRQRVSTGHENCVFEDENSVFLGIHKPKVPGSSPGAAIENFAEKRGFGLLKDQLASMPTTGLINCVPPIQPDCARGPQSAK